MVVFLDNKILCFQSKNSKRTIVRVFIGHKPQLFYRSTGHNSGMPGTFLPFDGIVMEDDYPVWFNKRRFTHDPNHSADRYPFGELYRYGTQTMKNISDALGQLDIPEGQVATGHEINAFLKEPFNLPECRVIHI